MTKVNDLTVFIGRFSPFHNGHSQVLFDALKISKAVVVLIGSSKQARTTKNPFTFEERKAMIETWAQNLQIDQYKLLVLPIYDHPYNDQEWIRGVQDAVDSAKNALVDTVGINPTIYLTGAQRDDSTWYLNAFGDLYKQDFIPKSDMFTLSATTVRSKLFGDPLYPLTSIREMVPHTTLAFLESFIKTEIYADLVKEYAYIEKYKKAYEAAPYPVTIQTVDTCVIQSGHVLVGLRDNFPGKGLWCMPGGHLEVPRNERLLDAAIRELMEETKIGLSKAQLYGSVRSKECFDHPERSLKGRVITMMYLLKLDDSKALPTIRPQKGEMKKVMWLPINEALNHPEMWFDDHYHMLKTMFGRL
jgi:bifunctional NMN adenylyltransferase/nudix hydrolase